MFNFELTVTRVAQPTGQGSIAMFIFFTSTEQLVCGGSRQLQKGIMILYDWEMHKDK